MTIRSDGLGRSRPPTVGVALLLSLASCNYNAQAIQYGAPPRTPVEQIRAAETQTVPCRDQAQVAGAATDVLRNLGMTIEASAPSVGIVAGQTHRDMRDGAAIAGQVALAVLFTGANSVHYDRTENLRATVLVSPPQQGRCAVRLAFERYVEDNKGFVRSNIYVDQTVAGGFFTLLARRLA